MVHVAVDDSVQNGFDVRVDHSYLYMYRFDAKGDLIETKNGCEGSHRDDAMIAKMRTYGIHELRVRGYLNTTSVIRIPPLFAPFPQ